MYARHLHKPDLEQTEAQDGLLRAGVASSLTSTSPSGPRSAGPECRSAALPLDADLVDTHKSLAWGGTKHLAAYPCGLVTGDGPARRRHLAHDTIERTVLQWRGIRSSIHTETSLDLDGLRREPASLSHEEALKVRWLQMYPAMPSSL